MIHIHKIFNWAIFQTVLSCVLPQLDAHAQTDSTASPLIFSAYAETYYVYDFDRPKNNTRPSFMYSFNRHNEVNLNLGLIKLAYTKNNTRANLALMAGTYANANLAAEPGVLKNIFEANVGFKLSKNKNLWLDAGIFVSHIGFESAIGKDCWSLTRGILADNSPYYESGAKITYISTDEKWLLSGLILNGWQRIQRIDGNSLPAFGHQLTYKPNALTTLNSSSFIGSDTPDSTRLMRYFHNFYAIFQVSENLGLTVGFDIGAQQKAKGTGNLNIWYAPIVMAKYAVSDKINLAFRAEYYSDANGVVISTGTANGFQTFGYSANLDYNIANNVVWRVEGRGFSSMDRIFLGDSQNHFLTTALAVSF
ncbi:MAG: porin [Saprospiraceae bacterium]|nr:porin [Saprospiraceae bacterium]